MAKKRIKPKPSKRSPAQQEPTKKATKPTPPIEDQYPNVAKWVQAYGEIEIGEIDWEGFQVKALDAGGLIFETGECQSLAEAMDYLEKALGAWFDEHGR